MQRIDPAFPDLLPLSHRLGPPPPPSEQPPLDPVEMRLVRRRSSRRHEPADTSVPKRPLRLLVHAETAAAAPDRLGELIDAGCGILLVLDGAVAPEQIPAAAIDGQVVVVAPWLPELWGGKPVSGLDAWKRPGMAVGVLVGLGPSPGPARCVRVAVEAAARAGAEFVLTMPLALPAEERHRVYDSRAGEQGDGALEDLLFHTDLTQLSLELEREATRACREVRLPEWLPGPATATIGRGTATAANAMLLWARRLDLLDGVNSVGWQLRRAARALLASGRDPAMLVADDNLRVVPGFNPWVEAFARALWAGGGEPFDESLSRWTGN